ncbi:DUF7019 family protein, partial [Streptomyces silvensis]
FDVSWMSEPTAWFRGDLGLRVAGYGEVNRPTLMTGQDGDTVVALIGSAHHLVGYQAPPEMGRIGFSGLPSLFRLLRDTPPEWEDHFNVRSRGGRMPSRGGVAQDVLRAAETLTVPPMYCEFLARQLMCSTVTREDGKELTILVGTPLYVAMSDEAHAGEGV